MAKHFWECEDCGKTVDFKQPELPPDDYDSEQNAEKICTCGGQMYFDEHEPDAVVHNKLITPPDDDR